MKFKLLFFLESVIIFFLVYIFGFFVFVKYLSPPFILILKIILSLLPILMFLSIFLMWLNGITFSVIKDLISDSKNPFGIFLIYFGYYLLLAFPVNFIVMILVGEAADTLLLVNFILLVPFASLGFIKGLFALRNLK